MGVDVQIWAHGPITDGQVAEAKTAFEARLPGFACGWADSGEGADRLFELQSMERYYGPGYERGSWPHIYAAIMLFRACFPGSVVSYAGDTWYPEDGDMQTDDAELARIWSHWVGPQWDDYHRGR